MELNPVLEVGDVPAEKLWYVLSSPHSPCARVGQAVICSENSLYVIGGADPSTAYNDVYRFDLTRHVWSKISHSKFEERYEHCAFVPECSNNQVLMFGGATKCKNLNCVQKICLESGNVSNINPSGDPPSPRTIHSAASSVDTLYIWSGGHQGSNPVPDTTLHAYNAEKNNWKQLPIKGELPSARHGHVMVCISNSIYIHGGMSGPTFHKDFYKINVVGLSSTRLSTLGDVPSARAGHAAVGYMTKFFIFGGLTLEGALDDMYQFDTDSRTWTRLSFESSPPTPRLDHSMVFAHLPIVKKRLPQENKRKAEKSSSSVATHIVPLDDWSHSLPDSAGDTVTSQSVTSVEVVQTVPVCVVFGGMDSSGNLFNDLILFRLD